jgi:hypothetical protein
MPEVADFVFQRLEFVYLFGGDAEIVHHTAQ